MKPFNQGYCWVVQARPRCMVLVLRNPNWFAVGRPAHSFVLGSCRLWINKFLQPILKFSLGSHSLPLGQAFYCDRQAGDRALGGWLWADLCAEPKPVCLLGNPSYWFGCGLQSCWVVGCDIPIYHTTVRWTAAYREVSDMYKVLSSLPRKALY